MARWLSLLWTDAGAGCRVLTAYLTLVNAASFLLFGLDKRRAKRGRWRVRESALLTAAFLGGAAGAWLAMRLFHHKTRKKRFAYGVPALLALHMALLLLFALRISGA